MLENLKIEEYATKAKTFSWEKLIAWVSNIIMLIVALLVSLIAFTGVLEAVLANPAINELTNAYINMETMQDPMLAIFLQSAGIQFSSVFGLVAILAKVYAIILIVVVVLGFIATISMRSRKFSAILFIITAIINIFGLWFVSIAYALVALLLFFRRN